MLFKIASGPPGIYPGSFGSLGISLNAADPRYVVTAAVALFNFDFESSERGICCAASRWDNISAVLPARTDPVGCSLSEVATTTETIEARNIAARTNGDCFMELSS